MITKTRSNRTIYNARLFLIQLLLLTLLLSTPQLFSGMTQHRHNTRSASQYKGWEPIFFEEIKKRANLAKLGDLKTANLGTHDLELRVWVGFATVPLEGFVIKRRSGSWSAIHLRSISKELARQDFQQALGAPTAGWECFWQELMDQGVLTLPGYSGRGGTDVESVVIEFKSGSSYRISRYDGADLIECPEEEGNSRILKTIRTAFNLRC